MVIIELMADGNLRIVQNDSVVVLDREDVEAVAFMCNVALQERIKEWRITLSSSQGQA